MNTAITRLGVGLVMIAAVASADMSIQFVYDTSDDTTVASYTGTMGVNHYGDLSTTGVSAHLSGTSFTSLPYGNFSYVVLNNLNGTVLPWNISTKTASGRSGSQFGFDWGALSGPRDFNPSTGVNGSLTFTGYDLSELGFDSNEISNGGTITLRTDKNEEMDINWSAQAIPEPATALLFGIGGMGAWLVRRNQEKAKEEPDA